MVLEVLGLLPGVPLAYAKTYLTSWLVAEAVALAPRFHGGDEALICPTV